VLFRQIKFFDVMWIWMKRYFQMSNIDIFFVAIKIQIRRYCNAKRCRDLCCKRHKWDDFSSYFNYRFTLLHINYWTRYFCVSSWLIAIFVANVRVDHAEFLIFILLSIIWLHLNELNSFFFRLCVYFAVNTFSNYNLIVLTIIQRRLNVAIVFENTNRVHRWKIFLLISIINWFITLNFNFVSSHNATFFEQSNCNISFDRFKCRSSSIF
jgi:hypothetical protein